MTKEEIAKLKELQQELLTQKPDGTRDPRLFIIMEPEYTVSPKGFEGNGYVIYDYDGGELIADSYTEREFKYAIEESIIGHHNLREDTIAKLRKCTTTKQVWDVICFCDPGLELYPLNMSVHPSYHAVFFTRKAAKEYLKANGHHHPEGSYTYSAYPDRCEDWQLVGKLLRELDFDKLETKP